MTSFTPKDRPHIIRVRGRGTPPARAGSCQPGWCSIRPRSVSSCRRPAPRSLIAVGAGPRLRAWYSDQLRSRRRQGEAIVCGAAGGAPRSLLASDAGTVDELAERGGGFRAGVKAAGVTVLEEGEADRVGQLDRLVGELGQRARRRELHMSAQVKSRVAIRRRRVLGPRAVRIGARRGTAGSSTLPKPRCRQA